MMALKILFTNGDLKSFSLIKEEVILQVVNELCINYRWTLDMILDYWISQ